MVQHHRPQSTNNRDYLTTSPNRPNRSTQEKLDRPATTSCEHAAPPTEITVEPHQPGQSTDRGLAAHRLARQIRRDRLTYLTHERLASLRRAAHDVGTVPGAVVECGVALGGSGIWLASLLKDREYHGYDVFDQIPPPGPQDPAKAHERYAVIASGKSKGLGEDTYYGYLGDLLDRVSASFASYNLTPHLHKGLFEDSLHPEWPIALAHIDCDWYEPVSVCLQRITPWLGSVPGSGVVLRDPVG
ncbi:TylF/MycF/NovP-related O-methyltransferase [Mycobacterium avium]